MHAARTNDPDVAKVGCLHEGILAEPTTKAQQHDTHRHQFIEKASGSDTTNASKGPKFTAKLGRTANCTRDMEEAGRSDAVSVGQRKRGDEWGRKSMGVLSYESTRVISAPRCTSFTQHSGCPYSAAAISAVRPWYLAG